MEDVNRRRCASYCRRELALRVRDKSAVHIKLSRTTSTKARAQAVFCASKTEDISPRAKTKGA